MSLHAYGPMEPPPRVARLRNLFDGLVIVDNKRQHAVVRSTWVYKEGLSLKWEAKAMLSGAILGQTAGEIELTDFEACRGADNPSAEEWGGKVRCTVEKKREAGQSSRNWGTQVEPSALTMYEKTLKAAIIGVCGGIVWERLQAYFAGEGGGWAADDGVRVRFPAGAAAGAAEAAAKAAAEEEESAARVHAVKVQYDKKYAETLRLMDALGVVDAGGAAEGGGEVDPTEADPDKIDFLCHGLKDADVARLAAGLARCTTRGPALVDLQHNAIEDAGVQALVVALAGGAAPALKELRLDGNKGITQVGRNLLTGLGLMRKGLKVSIHALPEAAAEGGGAAGDTVVAASGAGAAT